MTRFFALWITLGLALPAGASPELSRRTLRPGSGIDAPEGAPNSVRSGLEEALKAGSSKGSLIRQAAAGAEEGKENLLVTEAVALVLREIKRGNVTMVQRGSIQLSGSDDLTREKITAQAVQQVAETQSGGWLRVQFDSQDKTARLLPPVENQPVGAEETKPITDGTILKNFKSLLVEKKTGVQWWVVVSYPSGSATIGKRSSPEVRSQVPEPHFVGAPLLKTRPQLKAEFDLVVPAAGAEEIVLPRREAIEQLQGLVNSGKVTQISVPGTPGMVRGGADLKPASVIEALVDAAASRDGKVAMRPWGATENKVDLTPLAAGAEEGKAQITTATDPDFWETFGDRLTPSQRAEIVAHLRKADASGRSVEVTAVTGVTDFYLHTDGGLALVAGRVAEAYPVEGVDFHFPGDLSKREKVPAAFETPGLMIPDWMMPPFVWPEGSRPPVRVTEPVYASEMAEIRPAGWIALNYNPNLMIGQILSQGVLLITLHDDHGTAVLAFA